jgi:hypothetical protein
MKIIILLLSFACLSGCSTSLSSSWTVPSFYDEEDLLPVVSVSAQGWTVKPGPPEDETLNHPTTVVVNPKGVEFNIGTTQYPDIFPPVLWIVEVKELETRFLLIKIGPAASASVPMPILYLDETDRPTLSATIQQRWEFDAYPDDSPGYDPKIQWDGEHRLRDILFKDIDSDGVPELEEKDIWTSGGTITYFRFDKQTKSFIPARVETHTLGDETGELVWTIETWQIIDNQKRTMISRRVEPEQ